MADGSDDDDYEVGYSKPPKEHQFQKGKSGNPRGSAKRVESIPEMVRRVRDEYITIPINGRRKKMRMMEAAMRQAIANCIRGRNPRDLEYLFKLFEKHGVSPMDVMRENAERGGQEVLEKLVRMFDQTSNDPTILVDAYDEEMAIIFGNRDIWAALQDKWNRDDHTYPMPRNSRFRLRAIFFLNSYKNRAWPKIG